MKLDFMHNFDSIKCWAIGLHFFRAGVGTLVVLFGTSWEFGLSTTANAFGLRVGPLCIGGAK